MDDKKYRNLKRFVWAMRERAMYLCDCTRMTRDNLRNEGKEVLPHIERTLLRSEGECSAWDTLFQYMEDDER